MESMMGFVIGFVMGFVSLLPARRLPVLVCAGASLHVPESAFWTLTGLALGLLSVLSMVLSKFTVPAPAVLILFQLCSLPHAALIKASQQHIDADNTVYTQVQQD